MTARKASVLDRLRAAQASSTMVRIERRPRYSERVNGFVVGLGSKWVLVAATTDGGYFDGFTAIRARDVTRVRRDRSFEGVFARAQPQWPPTAPGGVDLDSTRRMLRTLAATAPLLGIEKEKERSATWIGEVVTVRRGWVRLHEVHPDATWHRRPLWYECRAVTRASVGSHYLTGLAAVAGPRHR
jgi:hypothetical protein